jgi:IS30 family transposase
MGKRIPMSLEERKQIEFGLKNGNTEKMICNVLNRHYSTVYVEIKKNGGRVQYNAENAQAEADKRKEKVIEGARKAGKLALWSPKKRMNYCLTVIENQINKIKELLNGSEN